MEAVAADLLQVLDRLQPAAHDAHALRVVGVVDRVRLRDADREPALDLRPLREAQPFQLAGRELDESVVVQRPQVVAREAEVLEPDTRLVRVGNHPRRPRAVVLDPPDAHRRLVDVDPVVGEQILTVHDERNGEEVAIAEPERRLDDLARRVRAHHRDDLAQRQRRDHRIGQLVQLVPRRDLGDAAAEKLEPFDGRLQPHLAALLLDRARHRLPHLPGAEARVVELRDQTLHVAVVAEERGLRRGEEREALDPLRGPFRADLRGRDTPHLLGVRLEEELEEPPAEAVRHPVLERLLDRIARRRGAQVRGHAARELDGPELADDVGAAQRVVEKALVPVDAGHPRTQQELLAEDLAPERLDLERLREEAVSAEVEAVTVDLDRLRETADLALRLEHDDRPLRLAEQVARREPSRPPAENERRPHAGRP